MEQKAILDKTRRPKGPSAIGDFDQVKAVAFRVISTQKAAEVAKTTRLRELRETRDRNA
ncbi:hypothetical protein QO002_000985 [Pararhizobium capsulatum DSM 1112]|uniref:Transposase n=1 Tax=Pararhizobium capsulatum DSM 1112 TaxID=1121113 RepID=A0ABU0BPQ0_9HYPH|nr:hypothetical protein [Pararhizobium capsulatum]MDQ0318847.1 hypothetical protein [Pararhizobium capsulatum DSM 1112]